jgi:hypothetical protein
METSKEVGVKQGALEVPKVVELGHVSEETKGPGTGTTENNPPRPFG